MLSRKFQFYLGIVNTFPAVFYIFLGIFSAFMHKISHSASPHEKFYSFWQRKCQEKCRKQLEKWWQFLGKISTCLTLLPHVGNLYSVVLCVLTSSFFFYRENQTSLLWTIRNKLALSKSQFDFGSSTCIYWRTNRTPIKPKTRNGSQKTRKISRSCCISYQWTVHGTFTIHSSSKVRG